MSMYVQETGSANSPSIVFLHGAGLSGWMWDRQVQYFSDYHCLVPDLPEQGKSAEVKPFTIRDCAEQVAQLIKTRAHLGKAHVVGLSLGAQVGIELLRICPEIIDHAVINSALVRKIPWAYYLAHPMANLLLPLSRSRMFAKLQAQAIKLPDQYFESYFSASKAISRDTVARIIQENTNFGLPSGLEQNQVPALILVGQKEVRIMRESAQDLVKVLPANSGYTILGIGHTFNFEAPELFNTIVRAWITDRPLPTEHIHPINRHH